MKTALIFGVSGLIGSELLKTITQNNNYNHIKLFVRSEQKNNNPKVEIIQTNFTYLEKHKNSITGNDCFFCIGTTKRDAPDKNEYRRIEQTIPINVGKIAKLNSVESFVYVSSIGANSSSSSLYLKNKGIVEEKLNNLNFTNLAIVRPSILLGKRKVYRLGESVGKNVMQKLSPLFLGRLKKYKPIHAQCVAKAMVIIAQKNNGKITLESDQLTEICKTT
jgi:nucleoside-diphosphate-sugar epimerase|tara:strand:+ start:198 stop:857 length:660 start_codon:yes stop_codon:yes gene_type:complete